MARPEHPSRNSLRETPAEWRHAYNEAGRWLTDLAEVAAPQDGRPGLGTWTLLELVGHASRALSTVADGLSPAGDSGAPAGDSRTIHVASAAAYYRQAAQVLDPTAIDERARQAGRDLGPDPASRVADLADRTRRAVHGVPDDALIGGLLGTMALAEYLPTRTFELVVHGCDICVAIGLPPSAPASAAASAGRLAVELAGDQAADVLLALTGRRPLPQGFTILGKL